MRRFMATHYIDNTGEIIVFTVLFIFLAILSAVFITFLVIKRNGKKAGMELSTDDCTQDNFTDALSDTSSYEYNVRNIEKQKAQMQYARAVIMGKEKYTAKLRRELDLVGILRWNEKRGGNMSSAVSELTGGESNTTELDVVMTERKVNEINRKPVDHSDTAGKFAMLDIGKPLCRLTDGFDETNLENAGFVQNNDKHRCHSYSALCVSEYPLERKGAENCKAEIVPYCLWTIAL